VILALVHDNNHSIVVFVDVPAGRYRIYNSLGPKHQGNDFVRDTMDTAIGMAARELEFS
jgi:hypothetical protein